MVGKFKTIYPSTYFVCHGYSNRPVSSNTDSYIEACFRPPTSRRENRQIFSYLSVCSGEGGWVQNIGGPRGAKSFAGFKLIRAPESNQCQIIAFLTLKTDNIAKVRIEIESILLEIPLNKIRGTYIKLVHL